MDAIGGASQSGYMIDKPNRISEVRKERRLTQQELAERLNTHWITVSKLERGVQRLTWPWMQRIAHALDVSPNRLVAREEPIATVWVTGVLEEDGALSVFEDDALQKRLVFSSVFDETYNEWYEVQGDLLWPFFKRGDLIGCTQAEKSSEHYLDRLVVFADEENIFRVGVIALGSNPGSFDLQVGMGRPMKNLKGRVTHYVATAIFEAPEIAPDKVVINNLAQQDIARDHEENEKRWRQSRAEQIAMERAKTPSEK